MTATLPQETTPRPAWRIRLEMICVVFGLVWSIAYPLISPYPATDLEIFINTATWVLTVPYLYARSLTFLLLHPIGWIGWGVQVNYVTGFVLSTFLQIIPAIVYIRALVKAIRGRSTPDIHHL